MHEIAGTDLLERIVDSKNQFYNSGTYGTDPLKKKQRYPIKKKSLKFHIQKNFEIHRR